MYFLEKEASKYGTEPAALEPVTESRKEGSVQEFGRGRFFLIVFGVINVRQWWENSNSDDGSGGADPNNYRDTKMTGYWKWDTPYPQLGTQRMLFMQEEYWYSPIMWQSWHKSANQTKRKQKEAPRSGHWEWDLPAVEKNSVTKKEKDSNTEGLGTEEQPDSVWEAEAYLGSRVIHGRKNWKRKESDTYWHWEQENDIF